MRIRIRKFSRVCWIHGVPVDFHWSAIVMLVVFVAAALILGVPFLFIAIGLFSVMLIHELGHAFLARRLGYRVHRIRIYPIHGLCLYETPYSPYEDSIIAWGGILGQLILFIPATATLVFVGNFSVGVLNVLLVMFSYINATIMITNLTPSAPFDGKKAWRLPRILLKAKWTMYQLKRKKILR